MQTIIWFTGSEASKICSDMRCRSLAKHLHVINIFFNFMVLKKIEVACLITFYVIYQNTFKEFVKHLHFLSSNEMANRKLLLLFPYIKYMLFINRISCSPRWSVYHCLIDLTSSSVETAVNSRDRRGCGLWCIT